MISPTIWEDPTFNNTPVACRLAFVGMFSCSDDEGYIRADYKSLKRLIFGFDDELSEDWYEQLKKFKSLHFFDHDGETYAHFVKWDEYQKQQTDRISPSTYPKCPTCHITTTIVLDNVEDDKNVNGNLPLRIRVANRDKMCRYCGIKFPTGGIKFILEHIVPKALGGSTDEDNCVLACQSCNTKKGRKTPEEAGMELLPAPSWKQNGNNLETEVSRLSKISKSEKVSKLSSENIEKNKKINSLKKDLIKQKVIQP